MLQSKEAKDQRSRNPVVFRQQVVQYPLVFFIKKFQQEKFLSAFPGNTGDLTDENEALLVPVCTTCNSAEKMYLRKSIDKEKEEWAYGCAECHTMTSAKPTRTDALKEWATLQGLTLQTE